MKINIPIEEQKKNAITWLDGLLSGSYKQTSEILGTAEQGFCCWGLGCYLINVPYIPNEGWNDNLYEYIGFNSKVGDIYPAILKNDEYSSDYEWEESNLAQLNDDFYMTFPEIAAYLIEYSNSNFSPEVSVHIDEYYKDNKNVKNILEDSFTKKYQVSFEEVEICE